MSSDDLDKAFDELDAHVAQGNFALDEEGWKKDEAEFIAKLEGMPAMEFSQLVTAANQVAQAGRNMKSAGKAIYTALKIAAFRGLI